MQNFHPPNAQERREPGTECSGRHIFRCLSHPFSPLPTLQATTIDEFAFKQESEYECGAPELDAPNLRDINALSPDIVPFVKLDLSILSAHNSLECFSISVNRGNIIPHLPRSRLLLPNLKFLSSTTFGTFFK